MTSVTRKKVSVTFAGDDDVLQHIIPINEKKKSPRKHVRSKKEKEKEEDIEPMEDEEIYKPSEALTDDKELVGGEVFTFKSNKKKGQMSQVALTSAQLAQEQSLLASPKSTQEAPKTLQNVRKRVRLDKNNNDTPQRLRKRNKPEYVWSSSEDSGESSSDDSDNEVTSSKSKKGHHQSKSKEAEAEQIEEAPTSSSATTPKRRRPKSAKNTPSKLHKESTSETPGKGQVSKSQASSSSTPTVQKRRGRPRKNEEYTVETAAVQEYFSQQGEAGKTSDRTLSRLECPRLDQETMNQVLSEVVDPYFQEKSDLYQEHVLHFREWMFYMCNGYNILLSGVGSKRLLLEDFRKKVLKEHTHLVINGYFPSITIKSVLNCITEDILEHKGSFKNPIDQCEFIRKHFECGDIHEDIYLVIHNIDGEMLRNEKVQTVLSILAHIKGFHIIASIDHINAPLIWDQSKSSRFNWLWQDVTTYAPYVEETSYENSLLVQQSGVLALSSLTHVFKSLTPNARGIFVLVSNYQLDNAHASNYIGIAFPDLYQRCREAFLVNSDLTLRTQLTEFRDHKLIRTKKVDGLEYLIIPLDDSTLKEFIQQQAEDT